MDKVHPTMGHAKTDTEESNSNLVVAHSSTKSRGWTEQEKKEWKERQLTYKKKTYDVSDYYWPIASRSWCRRIATNGKFERATLIVIVANALWIAYDSDNNTKDTLVEAEYQFVVAENLFCLFFTFEWSVRFGAFKRKLNCFKDGWFVFDTMLVTTMVFETWVMSIILLAAGTGSGQSNPLGNSALLRMARLLRLTRMARLGRLFRAVPELLIQIKGIIHALKAVIVTLVLLAFLLYVFAICFRQMTDGTEVEKKYFPDMGTSMYSLLVYGTFLDNLSQISDDILYECNVMIWFVFLLFVLCAALMVTNMLIGVLCEVVSLVAEKERDRMDREMVEETLLKVMKTLDENEDGTVAKEEFLGLLKNSHVSKESREAVELLQNRVGVDVIGIVDFVDFIFDNTDSLGDPAHESKTLKFSEFVETMMQLRGENKATVKDVVDMRKFMRAQVRGILDMSKKTTDDVLKEVKRIESMETKLDTMLAGLDIKDAKKCPTTTGAENMMRNVISANSTRDHERDTGSPVPGHRDSWPAFPNALSGSWSSFHDLAAGDGRNCDPAAPATPQAVALSSADKSRLQSSVSRLLEQIEGLEKATGQLREATQEFSSM